MTAAGQPTTRNDLNAAVVGQVHKKTGSQTPTAHVANLHRACRPLVSLTGHPVLLCNELVKFYLTFFILLDMVFVPCCTPLHPTAVPSDAVC